MFDDENIIEDLIKKFNINRSLLKTFFFSIQPFQTKVDFEQFKVVLHPLIKKITTKTGKAQVVTKILYALVRIITRVKEGWQSIIQIYYPQNKLNPQNKNIQFRFNRILDFFNWNVFREEDRLGIKKPRSQCLAKTVTIVQIFQDVLTNAMASSNLKIDEKSMKKIKQLIKYSIQNLFNQIDDKSLDNLTDVFSFKEERKPLFKAFYYLLTFQWKKRTDFEIETIIKGLGQWLSSLKPNKSEEEVKNFLEAFLLFCNGYVNERSIKELKDVNQLGFISIHAFMKFVNLGSFKIVDLIEEEEDYQEEIKCIQQIFQIVQESSKQLLYKFQFSKLKNSQKQQNELQEVKQLLKTPTEFQLEFVTKLFDICSVKVQEALREDEYLIQKIEQCRSKLEQENNLLHVIEFDSSKLEQAVTKECTVQYFLFSIMLGDIDYFLAVIQQFVNNMATYLQEQAEQAAGKVKSKKSKSFLDPAIFSCIKQLFSIEKNCKKMQQNYKQGVEIDPNELNISLSGIIKGEDESEIQKYENIWGSMCFILQNVKISVYFNKQIFEAMFNIAANLIEDQGEIIECFLKAICGDDISLSNPSEISGIYDQIQSKVMGELDIKDPKELMEKNKEKILTALDGFKMITKDMIDIDKELVEECLELLNLVIESVKSPKKMQENLKEIINIVGPLFNCPVFILNGIVSLMQGDYAEGLDLLKSIADIEPEKVKIIKMVLGKVQELVNKQMDNIQNLAGNQLGMNDNKYQELIKKVKEGKAEPKELFELADQEGDKSGTVDKSEFASLAKRLKWNLTQHRINEIYAKVKQKKIPGKKTKADEFCVEEFEQAVDYVTTKNAEGSLELMGLSTGKLLGIFFALAFLLILIFIFIFMGISAFAVSGGFESCINSLLTAGSGGAVGSKGEEEGSEENKQQKMADTVEQSNEIMQAAD